MLFELVRGATCRHEMNFVEIEAPVGGPCYRQMTIVNGIERSAEQRDTPWMMLGCGALRLRGGQYASGKFRMFMFSQIPANPSRGLKPLCPSTRPRLRALPANPALRRPLVSESCPGHRQLNGPALERRRRWPRKSRGTQDFALRKNLATPRALSGRWLRQAWSPLRSAASRQVLR